MRRGASTLAFSPAAVRYVLCRIAGVPSGRTSIAIIAGYQLGISASYLMHEAVRRHDGTDTSPTRVRSHSETGSPSSTGRDLRQSLFIASRLSASVLSALGAVIGASPISP